MTQKKYLIINANCNDSTQITTITDRINSYIICQISHSLKAIIISAHKPKHKLTYGYIHVAV